MVELKKVKEKLDTAGKDKARLEEQVKMLKDRRKELETELKELGIDDVEQIDSELLKMENELSDAMKKLDGANEDSIEEEIDLEALGL